MDISVKEAKVLEPGKITVVESQFLSKPLAEDELVVKLDSAPFNPSDFYTMMCLFPGQAQPPFRLGFEGFGEIESVGSDQNKDLIGKKCLFIVFNGSYATRLVVKRNEVYVLSDGCNLQSAKENFAVNPITAYELVQSAKSKGASSIIQTAASSNVAKWITIFAKREGMKSISVVRNIKHRDELIKLGASKVISTGDDSYEADLTAAIEEFKPTVLFDALGGDKPVHILELMPNYSVLVNYGSLNKHGLDNVHFGTLMVGKSITCYVIFSETTLGKPHEYSEKIVNEIYKADECLHEPIHSYKFDDAGKIAEEWAKRSAKLVLRNS